MSGKKKSLVTVILCMVMLLLSSCGDSGQAGVQEGNVKLQERLNDEQIYFASDLELEVESQVADVDFRAYGPSIYYPDGQTMKTYTTADRKTTVDIYTWTGAPGNWTFEKICYSGSGELYGLMNVVSGASNTVTTTETASTPYLCKFDAEKNLMFAKELAEYYEKSGESYSTQSSRLEVGTDGRAYISNSSGLWIFEEDGSYKGEVSFGSVKDVEVLDFTGDPYRTLYVLYEDKESQEQFVAEIDTESGVVTAVQQTITLTGIDATENGLLAYNGAIVYRYDREARSLTELFGWSECGVNGSAVYGVYLLADGSILAAGNVQGGVRNYLVKSMIVEKVAGSENGKTDIRIAMGNSRTSGMLSFAVSRFNKNNERYNIILEDYFAEGSAAGEARLNSELAAGTGPDLIDLGIGDVEELVESGYLEDLALYLEKSDVISEGDFLEAALEAYRVNGILTAIPQHFNITAMVGHSDYVGEESGWTLEEMVEFLEWHAGQQVFAEEPTRRYFFLYMFYLSESTFVDRSAGTCDFDNDLFRRLAELAEEYPVTHTEEEYANRPSEYTNLQNGNAILSWAPLADIQDLQLYDAALEGKMTCIGFPDEERKGVIAYYNDAFAISSNSKNKEGAWEFLEYYLTTLKAGSGWEVPTYRPSLEILTQRAMESGDKYMIGYGRDRWQYMKHPSTQEEIDEVMALIEAAAPAEHDGWTIINIIVEELEDYYAGEITLDAAIESIEKEVLLELAE